MMPGEHERERKPSTFVSDEKKLWALSELENGRSVREVSDELGVTTATLYNWRRYFQQFGRFTANASDLKTGALERRAELEDAVQAKDTTSYTRADRVRIVTAYEDGDLSAREIREKYGVCHADLLAWREQVGLEEDEPDAPEPPKPPATTLWEPASKTSTVVPMRPIDAKPPEQPTLQSWEVHEATKAINAEKAELQRQVTILMASHAKLTAELLKLEGEVKQAKANNTEAQKQATALRANLMESERKRAALSVESQEQLAELRAELEAARAGGSDAVLRAENTKLRERVRMLAQMLGEG